MSPAEPTPAELQRAAALVLAAAIVEAVQLGHGAAVVAVTEQLLAMGHQELIRALISAMVDARHSGEVGKVSVAALAAGKHRAVTELSGVCGGAVGGAEAMALCCKWKWRQQEAAAAAPPPHNLMTLPWPAPPLHALQACWRQTTRARCWGGCCWRQRWRAPGS